MTTVSSIISDAFRLTNLTAVGKDPTTDQQTEALRHINRIVKSVFGLEVGENLAEFPVGNSGYSRPAGYPGFQNTPDGNWIIPKNIRIMLNNTQPLTLYLHPAPDDGTRVAVLDVKGSLATNPVTINGNGRNIDGATSTILNTNSLSVSYMYRADLGGWVKYASLALVDTFPFPEEFDDFFIIMLAMRINPAYGKMIDSQSQMFLNRARNQMRSRYDQYIPVYADTGVLRMTNMASGMSPHNYFDGNYSFNPSAMFDAGRAY